MEFRFFIQASVYKKTRAPRSMLSGNAAEAAGLPWGTLVGFGLGGNA